MKVCILLHMQIFDPRILGSRFLTLSHPLIPSTTIIFTAYLLIYIVAVFPGS